MRERGHHQHGDRPCSCEMGNLYRFVEPIVLTCLARLGQAHGYHIAQAASALSVTHAGVDVPAVYRTLRRLETMGHVSSEWDTGGRGPARRTYVLTDSGRVHVQEWHMVLSDLQKTLGALTEALGETWAPGAGPGQEPE